MLLSVVVFIAKPALPKLALMPPLPCALILIFPLAAVLSPIAADPVPPWIVVALVLCCEPTTTVCTAVPLVGFPMLYVRAISDPPPMLIVIVLSVPKLTVPAPEVFRVNVFVLKARILNEPVEELITFPEEFDKVSVPVVSVVFLAKVIAVALVVPMLRVAAVAVSRSGVCNEVAAIPVPEMLKLAPDCSEVPFWI